MSFSPRSIGDTRALHSTFNTDSGTFSVASATLLMNYVDVSNGKHTTGVGVWSNITGNTADYTPDPTDVIQTTPGTYSFYPTANGVPMDTQIIDVVDPTKSPT